MDLTTWAELHDLAAIHEGWSIFEAEYEIAKYPLDPTTIPSHQVPFHTVVEIELQVQAIHGVHDYDETATDLDDDDEAAWLIVANGGGAHHAAARRLLAEQSPVEFSRIMSVKYGWGF